MERSGDGWQLSSSMNCPGLLYFSHRLAMWENWSPNHTPSFIDSACSTTRRISLERILLESHTASNSVPHQPVEIGQVLVISVLLGSEFNAAEGY